MGAKQSTEKKSSSSYDSIHEDWPWVWGIRDASHLDWKIGLNDDEIQEQALNQRELPVRITDNLFLGNAHSVESVEKLEKLGITAVLNMAGPLALRRKTITAYKKSDIRYRGINAEDELDYPLLENHWEEALDFINSTTKDGKGKIVVNCAAGMNRSGIIVSAYYMITTQTPVLETVRHVRKQRGNVALCNEGFQQQLVALARKSNLLGIQPGTKDSLIQKVPPPAENDWIFTEAAKPAENPLDRLSS